MGDSSSDEDYEIDEEWFKQNPDVVNCIDEFLSHVDDDFISTSKEYAECIPKICKDLQEWIDNLQTQETAVNATNTTLTVTSVVSTVALFTPAAPLGVAGLIGSGVGAAATTAGDLIANKVKGDYIKDVAESKKSLMLKAEGNVKEMNHLIKKVAEVGKIKMTTSSQICFGFAGVTKSAAGARAMLQGNRLGRLTGLFRVWRAGQLAPGGVSAIRGIAGAGSKIFGSLGAIVSIWATVDGWVNGNPTKNGTVKMKKDFEESEKAIKQLIALLERKGGDDN